MKEIRICGCDPQTNYECGGIGKANCPFAYTGTEYNMSVCEGRHDIPLAEDRAVFGEIEDPMDFISLKGKCRERFMPLVGKCDVLNLYVTGLTPALLTVINFCREHNMECITWHFNKANGTYKPLPME